MLINMPTKGDINVTIYTGDRQLWGGGRVRLVVIDPFSSSEKILVDHTTAPKTATVLLKDVPADRGQSYALVSTAKGRRDAGIYPVRPIAGGVKHTAVMLAANDPVPDFSGFSYPELEQQSRAFREALERGGIQETDLKALPPERIASALNIEAKLRNTNLVGRPAVEFVRRINGTDGIKQDRLLCRVDRTMPDQVRREMLQSGTFSELAEWANEVFHEGFPFSFKQRAPFGSLQLSFGRHPGDDDLVAADIDIDLFTDIGHLGEVARNHLTGRKTDPYTVYVQLFDQRIFPLYVLG